MHLLLILSTLFLACGLRLKQQHGETETLTLQHWNQALIGFLLPPLLLLMTAISILLMGPRGQMVWGYEGWGSTLIAIGLLGTAAITGLQAALRAWHTLEKLRSYPVQTVQNQQSRFLDTPAPMAARIGFWNSELVVSQGLLDTLTPEQIEAVLVHEQAHAHYRDTFWFFWLGWMYQWTRWLPQSKIHWQNLLMLRELRADDWAARQVEGLLLAESLMAMVQSPLWSDSVCAAFSPAVSRSRLEERIDALLSGPRELSSPNLTAWVWLLLALAPLLIVPFHH